MAGRIFTTCAVFLMLAFPAPEATAQSLTTAQFVGTGHVGSKSFPVTFRLSCALERGRITNFGVEFDIAAADNLKQVFDLGPFEGPTGIGAKTRMTATGIASGQLAYSASGFYSSSLPGGFTLSTAFRPRDREFKQLQSLNDILSGGPAHLVATVDNARRGGPALEAVADLGDSDSARVRAAIAACRGR